jgi:hypothetical protein
MPNHKSWGDEGHPGTEYIMDLIRRLTSMSYREGGEWGGRGSGIYPDESGIYPDEDEKEKKEEEKDPLLDPKAVEKRHQNLQGFPPRKYHSGTPSEDYVPQQVAPPYPREGFGADEIWSQFQAMNPDLDWGKVAEQAGGNVPGGNFSQMESSVTYTPTKMDEELFRFVREDIPRMDLARKLDMRSRAYDPEGAKILLEEMSNRQLGEYYSDISAAQMLQAKAAEDRAAIERRKAEYALSPAGMKADQIGRVAELLAQSGMADTGDLMMMVQIQALYATGDPNDEAKADELWAGYLAAKEQRQAGTIGAGGEIKRG